MNINDLGKGAVKDLPDSRDYQAPMGAVNVDWSKEFRLPEPPQSDQANADCCVGEAWSYYHWQLTGKLFSVKSIFAYIALDYGAYIRDGGLRIVNFGQETSEETPDPNPKTARNMRDKSGLNPSDALDDKAVNCLVLPQQDINGVAWGIKNYKGAVFGLNGSNEGWRDLKNPEPPSYGTSVWGHALYAMGYHMHGNQKCIIAKSSWKEVREHHIRENYFITGNTFNAWTLIPKESKTMKLVKDKGTVYIVSGNTDKRKIGIADEETLGLFGDEPQEEMDTAGIPEYQTISKGFVINNK